LLFPFQHCTVTELVEAYAEVRFLSTDFFKQINALAGCASTACNGRFRNARLELKLTRTRLNGSKNTVLPMAKIQPLENL